jgi:ribonuclease R
LQGRKKTANPTLCAHCSEAERAAESLEREVTQLKKVQFMKDKIGQAFDGTVSGVMPWGVFVQLPNTVEGLIPLEYLGSDYYVYVEKQMAIFGTYTKKRIGLGDTIRVVLYYANERERKLTFYQEGYNPHSWEDY